MSLTPQEFAEIEATIARRMAIRGLVDGVRPTPDAETILLLRLIADWQRMDDAMRDIRNLIKQLPSGIDEEADPENESPEDAVAHIGGLIWQCASATEAGT